MFKYEIWVNMNYEGRTDTHADKHTDKHINTITRPGLGAGPSENLNHN